MWNPIQDEPVMADFWAPRPSGFWRRALSPVRRFYLKKFYAVRSVHLLGRENLARIADGDGIMFAPNHSHDSDPHVMMEVARQLDEQFYFMAAWQIFKGHKGIDGFVLSRMGAFSVDREGCDRRALRKAIDLLATGRRLVVFPEGEIYHTNERLTPLREGVAFMATTACKELEKEGKSAKVWIVPTAIQYRYIDDISEKLSDAMSELEARMKLRPAVDQTLVRRVLRLGEALLAVKEIEQMGQAGQGTLASRIAGLIENILHPLESRWLEKSLKDQSISMRVKTLRQFLLGVWNAKEADAEIQSRARNGLDQVQLVMQLYSYPGDYVHENPTTERMAETIEKFQEDVLEETARPFGQRAATVRLGVPINVGELTTSMRPRQAATQLTSQLETDIRNLMQQREFA